MSRGYNKYDLYERSVQSAEYHAAWFVSIYKDIHGKYPKHLREDFCGTFQISCEWVKKNRNNTAIAIDLDPEPLAYGKRRNYSELNKDQKGRLQLLRKNVLIPTQPKRDVIVAGNFSFFIFKKRSELLTYFRACQRSLETGGALILESAGGPGMISKSVERKTVPLNKTEKFTYIWDQKSFDPISRNGKYSIHFKLPNGKTLRNAFHYDWRLWTIPETRDALLEAGFTKTYVYWETEHRGRGTGEYLQTESADNAYSWIAYIVGVK